MNLVSEIFNDIFGNPICNTDSYKVGHWGMYHPRQTLISSYFESRGYDKNHGIQFSNVVCNGAQYILKSYYSGEVVTMDGIDEAEEEFNEHFPYVDRKVFNRAGWEHIVKTHKGRIPLSIRIAPEGMVVPIRNVLLTVENTDPKCYWLTNYIESHLSQVWYPMTVATQSREFYKVILAYLYKTGTPADIRFKLADFGLRGSTCMEQAGIGGCANLLMFSGTDTYPACRFVKRIYNSKKMPGFSLNATEHSIMSSWGIDPKNPQMTAPEGEPLAMQHLLDLNPTGPVACVSDTNQIYKACREYWGEKFKNQVLSRDGVLIIRPDSSGKTKDGTYEDTPTVALNVIEILGDCFGFKVNKKGYKVLDPHIRVIWGDGINFKSCIAIMRKLEENGWSIDNITFGSGGALLQKVDRDTLSFAFKASYGEIEYDNKIYGYDIWKDPYHVGKKSKRGRLKLVRANSSHGHYLTTMQVDESPEEAGLYRWSGEDKVPTTNGNDLLIEVFRNGKMLHEFDFEEMRQRALPTVREMYATAQELGLGSLDYKSDNYDGLASTTAA